MATTADDPITANTTIAVTNPTLCQKRFMVGLRVLVIGADDRPCRRLEREATVKSAKDMKIVGKMTRLPRGIFYWNNLGGFAALNSIGGTQLSNNHGSR
jgi:hypothetical protein